MKKSLMQLQRIKQILIVFFTPIFGYIVYVYVVNFFHAGILKENESYFQTERFTHFFYNFQSSAFGVATIVGLFLVFAIPLFLLFVSKQCSKHLPFFLAVMINTPIALVATRAQEARIFALPLVFLWPYLGAYLYDFITSLPTRIYAYITFWKMVEMRALVMSRLCIVLTILGVYILFIFFVYQSFFMGATVVPYQWYAIVVGISIAFYSLMPTIPSNR